MDYMCWGIHSFAYKVIVRRPYLFGSVDGHSISQIAGTLLWE
jgi:hypothetical protein